MLEPEHRIRRCLEIERQASTVYGEAHAHDAVLVRPFHTDGRAIHDGARGDVTGPGASGEGHGEKQGDNGLTRRCGGPHGNDSGHLSPKLWWNVGTSLVPPGTNVYM